MTSPAPDVPSSSVEQVQAPAPGSPARRPGAGGALAAVFFEGAGGSSCGLRDAGFDTIGYEYWAPAVATARANGHDCRLHDLSDPARDPEIVDADLAWFSPPCQPFSAAGDGDGEFDERDGFPWTLRIIALKRYPVVIIENVKGLTFAKHADYLGGILQTLTGLGYEWQFKVLNCADLGVPQTRERCIIIARNDGGPITWPAPTHTEQPGMFTEPWVTMAQVLECAPTVTGVPAQWCWERPATTVSGDPRIAAPGHKNETNRQMADAIRLTIPELAALQGFPADYVWCGTKTAQAKQVGNAVPSILAQRLAEVNRPLARLERAA